MALITVAAGRYNGVYASVDVGLTQTGYTLQQDSSAELINQTDAYGDSVIDWIYRGGNCFLTFESKTWAAGTIAPFWPYGGGVPGVLASSAVPIGVTAYSLAAAMVLTPVANTPAATNAPGSTNLTASKSLLAPNSPAGWLFDSKVRNTPIRLQLLPNGGSSPPYTWFVLT